MRKLLLSIVCMLFAGIAIAQNALDFTFTRNDNDVTVAVSGAEGVTATITATSASNVWNTGGAMASRTDVLCQNTNTSATSESSPITYTLTVKGLNAEIAEVAFTHVAVNSGGNLQPSHNVDVRHCNFILEANGEVAGTLSDQNIWIPNGSTDKTFTFNNLSVAADNTLTIKLTLYKGTSNNGCFYGLTKITLTQKLVEEYEPDNTEAVAALSEAVTNAQTLFGQITVGDGMGEYTATDEEYLSKFYAIIDFLNTIESTKTPTPAEVEAKIDEVDAIIASFSLNMPKTGKYYRLKGSSGNYIDASAIYNNATATAGQMSMKSADACNFAGTVFYLDEDSKLLNYYTGTYITATREIAANVEAGGNTWTFSASSILGKYKIKSNDGNWLHDNSGNRADRCNQDLTEHAETHSWIIEEVVWKVVDINLAAGVVEKIETITIQFNQPVVVAPKIEIAGCEFVADVTEATETVTYTTATPIEAAGEYVLNIADVANVAFANGEPDSYAWVIEDVSTAVEVVVAEKENEIYDITGRKVKNISKAGIYIVNGCKVLVK